METKVSDFLSQAEQLARKKLWADAADICIKAKEMDATNSYVLNQLGWYLSRAKRYSEAIEIFKNLMLLEPQKAKWPYMLGYQYYDQQEWKEAISWFDKSLNLYPEYVVVLYRKGYAHTHLGENEKAINCFLKVVENFQKLDSSKKDKEKNNYSDSTYQLGKIYLTKGLTRKAEELLSESVEYDQKEAHKYYSYGKALLRNGKISDAIKSFKNAIRIDSRKDYFKDWLARAYAENGECEKGIKLLEKIPPRYRSHNIYRTLGEIYLRNENYHDAVSSLLKATQEQPKNHNYFFLLAKAYLGNDMPQKAAPLLKKAIELRKANYKIDFLEAEEYLNSILNDFPGIESLVENEIEGDGIIKFYKAEKGYGFISSDEYETDLFFHISSVVNPEDIQQGRKAQFDIEETEKGLSAVSVKIL